MIRWFAGAGRTGFDNSIEGAKVRDGEAGGQADTVRSRRSALPQQTMASGWQRDDGQAGSAGSIALPDDDRRRPMIVGVERKRRARSPHLARCQADLAHFSSDNEVVTSTRDRWPRGHSRSGSRRAGLTGEGSHWTRCGTAGMRCSHLVAWAAETNRGPPWAGLGDRPRPGVIDDRYDWSNPHSVHPLFTL